MKEETRPIAGEEGVQADWTSGRSLTRKAALGVGAAAVGGAALGALASADSAQAATTAILVYNVADYGALGDGSTDDYDAIAAAVADASTAGGGIVYFPHGTFITRSSISVPSNVVFRGMGWAITSIKMKNGANQNSVVSLASNTNIGFLDLTLDGNAANQSSGNGHVISGSTVSGLDCVRVRILGGLGRGISFASLTDARIQDGTIDLTASHTAGVTDAGYGIILSGGSSFAIKNMTIKNCPNSNISLNSCSNYEVSGNRLDTSYHTGTGGFNIFNASCSNFTIVGNRCLGAVNDSINMTTSHDFTVSANRVQNAGTGTVGGICIEVFNVCSNFSITGNVCDANGGPNGICLANGWSIATVTGNTCFGAVVKQMVDGPSQGSGILLTGNAASSVVTVSGNTCYDNGGSGIELWSTSTFNVHGSNITGNTCDSNGSAGIYLNVAGSGNLTTAHVVSNICTSNAYGIRISESTGKLNFSTVTNNTIPGSALSYAYKNTDVPSGGNVVSSTGSNNSLTPNHT